MNLLALIVIFGADQAALAGDGLRCFFGLEALKQFLLARGFFGLTETAVAKHRGVVALQILGVDVDHSIDCIEGAFVIALQEQDARDLVEDDTVARVLVRSRLQRGDRRLVVAVGLLDHRLEEVDAPERRIALQGLGDVRFRGLGLALRQLPVEGTVLYVTAHPDDENNGVLVALNRGRGLKTSLLTVTRGDGGQNEIGPELFQAIGILRGEELMAVHKYDGADQYHTRAFEFGYSFSVEETMQKWGHDEILADVVRAVHDLPLVLVDRASHESCSGPCIH